jgi:hypothetical protein
LIIFLFVMSGMGWVSGSHLFFEGSLLIKIY